ncbi:MAG TPA: radical SAM protein [Candidatus Xenobia bacterium]|jgi:uncharacterized protein
MNQAPARIYAPAKNLILYLTEDCNLRCTYCFVLKKPRRMSAETARKTVDFFFSRNVSGAENQLDITFFGGEPFMEMDRMEEVIEYARAQGPNVYKNCHFSATTNGTVATPRTEAIISGSGMRLLVSMDGGHGATRYRPFVSGKPSYDKVAENLPKLVSWASDVVVRMTFHPDALDLVGNVRHVLSLGAPAIALCPVIEAAWDGHEAALESAYQALADWYIEEARQGRIVPLEVTHALLQAHHQARHGAGRPIRPCGVGHSLIAVEPDGHVMPCHQFINRPKDWLGTVHEPALDATKRLPYLQLSSRTLLGCDTCLAEPVCGGGCRAVVVNAGLDLQKGTHPGYCLTTRAHAQAVYRIYDTLMAEQNAAFLSVMRGRRPLNAALTELVST